ncbi:MAG: Uma2 family endonuclease [Pseudomonadota bacterium]
MTGFADNKQQDYEAPLDKAAFLDWVQGRESRFELKGGRIVMMTGGSKNHARITGRIAQLLANALDAEQWAVTSADLAVEIGPDVRYPDVLVEPLDDQGDALSTSNPVLIAEVLSPSSAGTGMNEKAAECTSLTSLQTYLVVSQKAPIVWVWQRDPASGTFPRHPVEIAGRDKAIEIAALGITLPLAEIFRGIASA